MAILAELIDSGSFAEALEGVNADLGRESHPFRQAKLLHQVARSLYKRGRFAEAAEVFQRAASLAADSGRDWLAPRLASIHAHIKAVNLVAATQVAEDCLNLASQKAEEFTNRRKNAEADLARYGRVVVPIKPHRPCVVATRLGELFFAEGEWQTAQRFLEEAIRDNPRGGTRARQTLAEIALRLDDAETAFQRAVEAITLGKFQAKTLAAWKPLFAAKRKLGQSGLSPEFRASLRVCHPSVRARATLVIVRELRSANDPQWQDIANEWLESSGDKFPAIVAELRKMQMAETKRAMQNPQAQLAQARELLDTPSLAPHEWLAGAKEVVRASLFAGAKPGINSLVRKGTRLYGEEFSAQLQHSLALSCMMAKRHDLAREVLASAIATASVGNHIWSKATWALARMEAFLKNYAAAATAYLNVAEATTVPPRFRLQARVLWAENLLASGDTEALKACAASLPSQLEGISDFETLLDFARQLSRSEGELANISDQIFEMGRSAAVDAFEAASHPSAALDILFKLTRRQVYDFGRSSEVTAFWEGLPESKALWLWNNDNRWWGYIAFVLMAYCRTNRLHEAAQLAQTTLDDPATPREALPTVLIPYYEELINKGRAAEALDAFRWIVTENPTKAGCATAYYWLALEAYSKGNTALMAKYIESMSISNAQTSITSERWGNQAKIILLRNPDFSIPQDTQAVELNQEWFERARRQILRNLTQLTQ